MEPLISVIVPVYKVEQYLHQCVDSILNQTYRNLEVILVDDGSPDGCPAICNVYAEKDERVRVIHKVNGGLSDARNAGMAVMNGEYLSFVDSDDLLPVDAVETLLKIAVEEGADLVIGGHNRFEDVPADPVHMEISIQRWTPVEAMADMLRNGCASWARLYRRELHQSILFPVGEINEDEAIVLSLLEKCGTIAVTNAIVYHYRCRPESITTAHFSEKKLDWYWHCKANLEWIQENHPELEPLAIDRLGSSIVFLLDEMAKAGFSNEDISSMLLSDLRKDYHTYQKYYLSGPKAKVKMWLLSRFPYKIYCGLVSLRGRIVQK